MQDHSQQEQVEHHYEPQQRSQGYNGEQPFQGHSQQTHQEQMEQSEQHWEEQPQQQYQENQLDQPASNQAVRVSIDVVQWAYYGVTTCPNWGNYHVKIAQLAPYSNGIGTHLFSNRVMVAFPNLETYRDFQNQFASFVLQLKKMKKEKKSQKRASLEFVRPLSLTAQLW